MNRFRQHIPRFISGASPIEFDFETLDQLMTANVIKQALKNNPGFQLMMSDTMLMIVNKRNTKWWVLGYIKHPNQIKLPQWSQPKK